MLEVRQGPSTNRDLANYKPIRRIACGVDWLSCSIQESLPPELFDQLKPYAAVGQLESPYTFNHEPLMLSSNKGCPIVLHNAYLDLRILSQKGDTRAMVTVYSPFLWSIGGLDYAVADLQQWVDVLYARHVELTVSRCDFCYDIVGYDCRVLESISGVHSVFVAQARYARIEQTDGHTVYVGAAGSEVRLRIYDKSAELAHSGKDYYQATWAAGGWIAELDEKVTRFEFVVKRDALHTMHCGDIEVKTVWDLLEYQDSIHVYLTQQWCRMVVPSGSETNRTRLETSEVWVAIQAPWSEGTVVVEVDRYRLRKNDRAHLASMAVGTLVSIAALTDGAESREDIEYIVHCLLVMEEQRQGLPMAELVHQRRLRLFG